MIAIVLLIITTIIVINSLLSGKGGSMSNLSTYSPMPRTNSFSSTNSTPGSSSRPYASSASVPLATRLLNHIETCIGKYVR